MSVDHNVEPSEFDQDREAFLAHLVESRRIVDGWPGWKRGALFPADISQDYLAAAEESGSVACDIETSGLDWASCHIGAVQVYSPQAGIAVIRPGDGYPARLVALLQNSVVSKIFHHAMFDLRFMAAHWGVRPTACKCTKICAKLLGPELAGASSLKPLVKRFCGVELDKTLQISNWMDVTLTEAQIQYATYDVIYLPMLYRALIRELELAGKARLAHLCFDHLPARVELDLGRYEDVYVY